MHTAGRDRAAPQEVKVVLHCRNFAETGLESAHNIRSLIHFRLKASTHIVKGFFWKSPSQVPARNVCFRRKTFWQQETFESTPYALTFERNFPMRTRLKLFVTERRQSQPVRWLRQASRMLSSLARRRIFFINCDVILWHKSILPFIFTFLRLLWIWLSGYDAIGRTEWRASCL